MATGITVPWLVSTNGVASPNKNWQGFPSFGMLLGMAMDIYTNIQ